VNPPQPRPTGLQAASCWSAVRRWLSRSRRPPDDPRAGAPSDLPADPCFSALFGQVADGLLLCRADGQVLAGNPAAATLFDRDAAGLAGVRLHDLLHQGSAACADPASVLDGDASAQRVSGVRRVEVRARPIDAAPGRPWLLHLRDTAERAQAQERLTYLANFDRLTGLPNRALFRDRLAQAMARARRSGRPMALLVIDLDRFKIVNDSLGHDVGDRLLQHVTRKLSACLREVDSVARAVDDFSTTLSRLGGDEFTVIAEGVQAAEDAASIARRLLDALATPFHAGGEEIVISGSIGISLYPTDDVDLDGLLRHTDMAMYRSKSLGRGMYSFFSDDLNAAVSARLSLEGHLRRAVEREEFTLHYQPKADLGTGRVTGVEALLRWHRPGHGLVPPDRFISVLEDTGLILPVGAWVIRTACRQLADWDRQGLPPLRMAVNLSARQFRHLYLASLVADSLRENAIEPRRLEIELTESLLMEDTEGTRSLLEGFSRMGVRLAIDDFGTGHSSLSYLRRFKVDTLKIDRSFVQTLPDSREDTAIASAVIALGRSMGMNVVAEGVETQDQADLLGELGCNEIQGYLLGRPMPPEAFCVWMQPHLHHERNQRVHFGRLGLDRPMERVSIGGPD
jgi:diguanylate cyclase (GGDEF)-like protein